MNSAWPQQQQCYLTRKLKSYDRPTDFNIQYRHGIHCCGGQLRQNPMLHRRIWQLERMHSPAKTHRRKANNRCLPGCLRCHSKWQRRSRIFWQCSWKQTQIIGRCGCSYSIGSIHCPCNWKNYSSGVRQHFNHGLLEPYGRTKPRIESDSKCSTGRGYKQSRINYLLSHTRKKTASDRLSRLNDRYEWQLHPELFNFLDIMRGPHTIDRFASGTTVYYSILSAKILRCKRSGPARLDTAQQFRKCTISSYARNTTSA